jgi:hypothetical protein
VGGRAEALAGCCGPSQHAESTTFVTIVEPPSGAATDWGMKESAAKSPRPVASVSNS